MMKCVWFLFTEAISFVHPNLLKTGASTYAKVAKRMQKWPLNRGAFRCFFNVWSSCETLYRNVVLSWLIFNLFYPNPVT